MPSLHSLRKKHWILLVAGLFLLVAQLGIATHALHAEVPRAELTCSFCLASAPPIVAAPSVLPERNDTVFAFADVPVRSVCDRQITLSPRLSRGPPASDTHV